MKLLVIDTATEACSVALEVDGKVFTCFEVCPQQHSQRILPMIDQVLKEANIELQQLDCLAVGRGPGSFTGVRIATGIIQGLALGTGHKVVAVSTLAAMAQQALIHHPNSQVFAAIDARMSEVYFAQYQLIQGKLTLVGQEQVLPPKQARALTVNTLTNDSVIGVGTGWRAYPELNPELDSVKMVKAEDAILYPNAEYMLPIAKQAIKDGLAVEVEELQPVYLRDKVTWKKLPGRE